MSYIKNNLIAIDQLANAVFNGSPDETISARCWRLRTKPHWNALRIIVDTLFFWATDHCYNAWLSEMTRKQLPREYQ